MATVIGLNREPFMTHNHRYEMYLRDSRGYKYRICMYEDGAYGIKDLFMCASISQMTKEEYLALPDKIEI